MCKPDIYFYPNKLLFTDVLKDSRLKDFWKFPEIHKIFLPRTPLRLLHWQIYAKFSLTPILLTYKDQRNHVIFSYSEAYCILPNISHAKDFAK